ncbi:hypothetical protein CPB84DRAFT_1384379 [Gymnopilus junonius]|uniref:DUF6593 domain-containing protein n=1 Tax=Gymnopilus junonius TaxID=109634 RepID=A0A9P5NJ01_GYMJU|nr:hypothetical protein CPB84DRAFT_1384379 [Gymnopilus junonius]
MVMSGMQLCLVDNDPISTLLITPDGEALFSIETPPLHPPNPQISTPQPRQRSPITTVKRLERYHRSTGHTETEIGTAEYSGPVKGTHLQLCEDNLQLDIPPLSRRKVVDNETHNDKNEEDEDVSENSWAFKGPDSRHYKWQLFLHAPLLLDDQTFTPLARYRRAKLGIVSRSRRAFLEILPAGINLIDFIVVTFVGFMKQRLLIDGLAASSSSSSPSAREDDQGPNSVTNRWLLHLLKGPQLQRTPHHYPGCSVRRSLLDYNLGLLLCRSSLVLPYSKYHQLGSLVLHPC